MRSLTVEFVIDDKRLLGSDQGYDDGPRMKVCTRRADTMATVTIPHIHCDEREVAWIDDTNVKVIEVVLDWLAHGSSPEELHLQYPHLSLAQIHAAFAYYYDHRDALDAVIERQLQEVETLAAQVVDSPVRRRLRALGKLR